MLDLICDVIDYCALSFAMGKISVVKRQIVIKNLKGEEMDIEQFIKKFI